MTDCQPQQQHALSTVQSWPGTDTFARSQPVDLTTPQLILLFRSTSSCHPPLLEVTAHMASSSNHQPFEVSPLAIGTQMQEGENF